MHIGNCVKQPFTVIGKLGSTKDGDEFIKRLWADANSNFADIAHLVKKDENGAIVGLWGAMSDFTGTFQPWGNHFSEGLYLAGAECIDEAGAPAGWTKWVVPGYEYLTVEAESSGTFSQMIAYLAENRLTLAGAVHEFNCPQTGKTYLYFPIRAL